MNKSARLLIFLFLLVILADRIIGFLIEKAHTQNPPRNIGALNHVISQEKPYQQLIIGSSRALHGVIPQLLTKKSFNMGWDGTAIDMHLAVLKVLESKKKLPKVILLNLDEKMVFDTGTEYVGIEELSTFYNKNEWVSRQIDKQSKYNSFLYLLKTYKFNGKISALFNPTDRFKNDSARGYLPLKPQPRAPKFFETLIERKLTKSDLLGKVSSDLNPLFVSHFLELLNLAQVNKVKLIVFSPPLYGTRIHEPAKKKLYDLMCKKGVTYLDYRSQFRIDKGIVSDDTLWKDLSHLNNEGAKVFTKRLNKDIEYLLSTNDSLPQELRICN